MLGQKQNVAFFLDHPVFHFSQLSVSFAYNRLSREGKTLAVETTEKKLTEFSLNAGTGYCHRLGENGIYRILFLILYTNA